MEPPEDDVDDDFDGVTPFPGYMKSVYSTSSADATSSDYDDYIESVRRKPYLPTLLN